MNKTEALYHFYSGFGLQAIEENVLLDSNELMFPFLTYSVSTDGFGSEISLNCSLWYRGTSWISADEKAEEISQYIGQSGILLDFDDGKIWIKRGSPFAQNMSDDSDDLIKRKIINITAEFFSVN